MAGLRWHSGVIINLFFTSIALFNICLLGFSSRGAFVCQERPPSQLVPTAS
jgi:hypothetical protein